MGDRQISILQLQDGWPTGLAGVKDLSCMEGQKISADQLRNS